MSHFSKCIFSVALLLPIVMTAQNSDFAKKAEHKDIERIYNICIGSQNPAFIGRNAFSSLADITINYTHRSGSFHDVDDGKTINGMNVDFYGIKKIDKLTFEGSFAYDYAYLSHRKWNSTLFLSSDNPYTVGDNIESGFSNEIFHLDGGVSYDFSPRWAVGVRADYHAGRSSNQNDPRPEIDGMRFRAEPGVTFKTGSFVFGLAGRAEWFAETLDYDIARTTDYYTAYLMQGLSQPTQRYSGSFDRRYNGNELGASTQFEWKTNAFENFLELGYSNNCEKAEDYRTESKYRGGKYKCNSLFIKDRFMFGSKKLRHTISATVKYNKTDGTTYEQRQTSDADGNTTWELLSSDITYQSKHTNAQLGYHIDLLSTDDTPKATGEFYVGMNNRREKEFPNEYFQNFTTAYFDLNAKYRFNIRKIRLAVHLGGRFNTRLSHDKELQGTVFDESYITPKYEYASAEYFRMKTGFDAKTPLNIKGLHTWIGIYADYSYTHYTGSNEVLKDACRNALDAGVKLLF